jgi:hypothetical protein
MCDIFDAATVMVLDIGDVEAGQLYKLAPWSPTGWTGGPCGLEGLLRCLPLNGHVAFSMVAKKLEPNWLDG